MATIRDALRSGILDEYGLPDHEIREPLRPLYVASTLFDSVENDPQMYDEKLGAGGRTRFEQLIQLFGDFRCSIRPLVGDLNRVTPTRNGVWKMQCPGLRIFGWVPEAHSFVAVEYAMIESCHGRSSIINEKVESVLNFAKQNDLEKTISIGDRLALFPA